MRVVLEMSAGLLAGLGLGVLIETLRASRFAVRLARADGPTEGWDRTAARAATRLRRKLTVILAISGRRA